MSLRAKLSLRGTQARSNLDGIAAGLLRCARNDMQPLRVAVLMGGISSEREISLRSGAAIAAALASRGHMVRAVDVVGQNLRSFVDPRAFDIAFIALHGRFGEDGKVQSQCEDMGLAYTGSRPESSALALDKVRSKEKFVADGIPTPRYRVLRNRKEAGSVVAPFMGQSTVLPDLELAAASSRIEKNGLFSTAKLSGSYIPLNYPIVVKPPWEGSSIGLTIVHEPTALSPAVDLAFRYGDKVLLEEFIAGKELTVGILGEKVLPVIQIVPNSGVYDYHAKYTPGQTQYLVPAPVSSNISQRSQELAWKAFRALGCEDFGRVDIMLDKDNNCSVLEVNTIPGFTQTSLLPKAASAVDIGFEALCERILELGLKKVPVGEK